LSTFSNVLVFLLKSIIVATLTFTVIIMLLPNTNEIRKDWKYFYAKQENKALILSFVQNPVALRMSGERDFEHKEFADAALKFELAIGLLEMHGATPETIHPYQIRFSETSRLLARENHAD